MNKINLFAIFSIAAAASLFGGMFTPAVAQDNMTMGMENMSMPSNNMNNMTMGMDNMSMPSNNMNNMTMGMDDSTNMTTMQ
jgi:hypothetical protein